MKHFENVLFFKQTPIYFCHAFTIYFLTRVIWLKNVYEHLNALTRNAKSTRTAVHPSAISQNGHNVRSQRMKITQDMRTFYSFFSPKNWNVSHVCVCRLWFTIVQLYFGHFPFSCAHQFNRYLFIVCLFAEWIQYAFFSKAQI